MGVLGAMVAHPEELYPMVKLKMAMDRVRRQIPAEPHWHFSYLMLQKVSRSFALVIQQLRPQLRNAVCVFYLVLRALDTVEDDTSIPSDIKVPILQSFYRHIYDREWHFSCKPSIT
ncbi:squalene synthase 1-like [Curcuma longa]|uniref:squalene synthase 1-like n=1 Tax=Curcuma longa TaxID=136217 RepID=UPI003D9DDA34